MRVYVGVLLLVVYVLVRMWLCARFENSRILAGKSNSPLLSEDRGEYFAYRVRTNEILSMLLRSGVTRNGDACVSLIL